MTISVISGKKNWLSSIEGFRLMTRVSAKTSYRLSVENLKGAHLIGAPCVRTPSKCGSLG